MTPAPTHDAPEPEYSGVSGDQSNEAEHFSEVTQSKFPHPYAQELAALDAEGASGFGGRTGVRLTIAAYQQLEHELRDARGRVHELESKVDDQNTRVADLRVENAQLNTEISSLRRLSWVSGFLYIVGSILISFGISEFGSETGMGAVLSVTGCTILVAAFLLPKTYSRR